MTYREVIEKSLYPVEIEDYTVSEEEQKTEIRKRQMLPLPLQGFLFSMAAILTASAEHLITTMPSYGISTGESESKFSQKKNGQVSTSDILQVFIGNDLMKHGILSVQLNRFLTWLLDEEIPEPDENETLWYDIQSVGSRWNEFAMMKMEENQ